MSFLAKLVIDDQEYDILSFSFGVEQQVDYGSSRPTGLPKLKQLRLSIESSASRDLFAWAAFADEQKDGEIIFYKRDAMASSRTIAFRGAFCVNYHETFNSTDTNSMVITIELVVQSLDYDDVSLENYPDAF